MNPTPTRPEPTTPPAAIGKQKYPFLFAAQKFWTEEPFMQVADILKMVNGSRDGHFFEDKEGKNIYYGHDEKVDMTKFPHFSVLLPATMNKGAGL